MPNNVTVKGSELNMSTVIGSNFILIPAGTFLMGSPAEEPERSAGEQQHQVTISKPFYMQTTPVTHGQWKSVRGGNPSFFKDGGDDCPVEQVSWDDVQEFIRRLNRQEGVDKYYLPTEVEWEYAARSGGSGQKYPGTDNEAELGNYAWYGKNSGCKTHPVEQKKPNGLGLYDMAGNVYEWCQDWFGNYPLVGNITDPLGPLSGSHRVVRGGSWFSDAVYCRSASRYDCTPDVRFIN